MADLISGQPHSPLVELDLELEFDGCSSGKRNRILVIDDPSALNYIDKHGFHTEIYRLEYVCGAFWPFKAVFVFGDGSRCYGIVNVPNKPGFLVITYPVNALSFDELDDEKYVLDLEPITPSTSTISSRTSARMIKRRNWCGFTEELVSVHGG